MGLWIWHPFMWSSLKLIISTKWVRSVILLLLISRRSNFFKTDISFICSSFKLLLDIFNSCKPYIRERIETSFGPTLFKTRARIYVLIFAMFEISTFLQSMMLIFWRDLHLSTSSKLINLSHLQRVISFSHSKLCIPFVD